MVAFPMEKHVLGVNYKMKILCIIGCSSGGKDTFYNTVLGLDKSIKPLVSHTTRPMREGEIEGREYYFITQSEFMYMLETGRFIETREYNTKHGMLYYGLTMSEINDEEGTYIGIFDSEGTNELIERFGEDKVTTIYIDCPLKDRVNRSFNREPNATLIQQKEMLRRQLSDMERIEPYKKVYDYIYYNDNSTSKDKNCENIVKFITQEGIL